MKHPLGGKTGTTNDYTDAWFVGFSPSITCGTWIGFDDRESLGEKETGARAALPMWMDFMRAAIATRPDEAFPTAGAAKKKLDVPLGSAASVATPVRPLVKKQVADDSASTSGEKAKGVLTTSPPAVAAPSVPVEKPKANGTSPQVIYAPVKPASVPQAVAARVKPAAMSAKPADERSGVSNPPPDIY
ncbi:hypothetical protein RBB78_22705 [Tunturiibacter empetritectus]|uniref:hypothetical protein n=1 Tax=Tunturiibacter empetritectus TaxID=3069691 RepID=UPI003D9BCF8D